MSLTDDYKQNVADMHLQQKKNILHIWQIIVSVMPDGVPGFFFCSIGLTLVAAGINN